MPRLRVSIPIQIVAAIVATIVAGCADDPADPGQTRIAFASARGTLTTDIYVMNADGSGQRRLTFNPRGAGEPSWSPDGSYIVFQRRWQDATQRWWGGIFRVRPDGFGETCIDSIADAFQVSPRVSPDGSKIAFCQIGVDTGTVEVWVMNADGSAPVNLTPDPAWSNYPDWSPDGTRIVYARQTASLPSRIYTMKSDGSDTVRVVETGVANSFQTEPRWSPDGSKIAYVDNRGSLDQLSWIYVVHADGSNVAPVTPLTDGLRDWPSWSPDGQKIAYRDNYRNGAVADGEIYMIGADGSGETNVTRFPAAHDITPDWGPAGTLGPRSLVAGGGTAP